MKKNKLYELLSQSVINQVPLGILLASEINEKKIYARLARSEFHRSEKYHCYDFYKPISKIVKPPQ